MGHGGRDARVATWTVVNVRMTMFALAKDVYLLNVYGKVFWVVVHICIQKEYEFETELSIWVKALLLVARQNFTRRNCENLVMNGGRWCEFVCVCVLRVGGCWALYIWRLFWQLKQYTIWSILMGPNARLVCSGGSVGKKRKYRDGIILRSKMLAKRKICCEQFRAEYETTWRPRSFFWMSSLQRHTEYVKVCPSACVCVCERVRVWRGEKTQAREKHEGGFHQAHQRDPSCVCRRF